MRFVAILLIFLSWLACGAQQVSLPAWYETTTSLNVRASDNTSSRIVTVLPSHTRIRVDYITDKNWAAIQHLQQRGYVSTKYIKYVEAIPQMPTQRKEVSSSYSSKKGIISWLFDIGILIVVIIIIRKIAIYVLGIGSICMYWASWVAGMPFYILNWMQRFIAKPWRILYKNNDGRDYHNAKLRERYQWVKIPLYVVLTPLRLLNAFYYNIIVHCSFEMYNYIVEVFLPSNDKEGGDDYIRLILFIPWRVLKYVVWHGGLTFIESTIWTVIDTFIPALTLFHGTNEQASTTITHAGRNGYSCHLTGIWNVGGGNFAGNGIYFAPVRKTAMHYARGSLIVCRVSLGKVLDLGLAPHHVYRQCGSPNATGATKWGLNNKYVTGEWWRKDTGWWEYCMYDWKNRYNYSWRIRPLYVLNLNEHFMQRIPGGMCHWLFRKMVIEDIMTSIEEAME